MYYNILVFLYIGDHEDFIKYCLHFGLYEQAEKILELMEKFAEICNVKIKDLRQINYENEHPELAEIYPEDPEFKEIQRLSEKTFSKYKHLKFARGKY